MLVCIRCYSIYHYHVSFHVFSKQQFEIRDAKTSIILIGWKIYHRKSNQLIKFDPIVQSQISSMNTDCVCWQTDERFTRLTGFSTKRMSINLSRISQIHYYPCFMSFDTSAIVMPIAHRLSPNIFSIKHFTIIPKVPIPIPIYALKNHMPTIPVGVSAYPMIRW